jgi:hypothetical protein
MSDSRSRAGFRIQHDGQKTPHFGVLPSESPESAEFSELPMVGMVRLRNDGQQWLVTEYCWGEDYTHDQQADQIAERVITGHYVPNFRVREICVDGYNGATVDTDGYFVKFDLPFGVPCRRRFQAQVDYRYWITRIHLDADTDTSIEIYLMR